MTDGFLVALAPTLAVIVAFVLGQWQQRKTAEKLARSAAATDERVDVKLGEIHVLVNKRLELALHQIASLEKTLAELGGHIKNGGVVSPSVSDEMEDHEEE